MNIFNKFVKSVEEDDMFILFEIVIDNNANVNFSILTREFLLMLIF